MTGAVSGNALLTSDASAIKSDQAPRSLMEDNVRQGAVWFRAAHGLELVCVQEDLDCLVDRQQRSNFSGLYFLGL